LTRLKKKKEVQEEIIDFVEENAEFTEFSEGLEENTAFAGYSEGLNKDPAFAGYSESQEEDPVFTESGEDYISLDIFYEDELDENQLDEDEPDAERTDEDKSDKNIPGENKPDKDKTSENKADEDKKVEDKPDDNRAACVRCSVADAVIRSKQTFGYPNLPYMEKITGISVSELTEQLEGKVIWQDPVKFDQHRSLSGDWLFGEQYFTGNPFRLLKKARQMHEKYGRFQCNIDALRERLHGSPDAGSVFITLGATWIPDYFYSKFIQELLKLQSRPVVYLDERDRFIIRADVDRFNVINTYIYGTEKMSALEIIERVMNGMPVKVMDAVPHYGRREKDYVINKEETLAAEEKKKLIVQKFEQWVHADPEVEERLLEVYWEQYGYIGHAYRGDFLEFPGLNPELHLYTHQKNAVARIIFNKQVFVAHDVGTGKTDIMICGSHELRRMGISKKNLHVIPNNGLDDAVSRHRYDYPKDRLLVIYPKDFTPAKRREALEKIRDTSCDAIYMAFSSFDKIKMSKQYYLDKKEKEIERYKAAVNRTSDALEKRALKRALAGKVKAYDEMRCIPAADEDVRFDRLGITGLFVDEVHNYKNITLEAGMEHVIGMHTTGSAKCDEMLEKVHYVQQQDGNVVFATGTPLTNSLSDVFVWQKYLQEEELEFCKISKFSHWLNTFAEQETSFEIDVDSKNFRFVTRFIRFHNLPELMNMFAASVCDFFHSDNEEIELPYCAGHTDIVVKKSPEQAEYIYGLAERTENIRNRIIKSSKEDNLLKVVSDGKKCALDIRLVRPEVTVRPGHCKIDVLAEQMVRLYWQYPGTTQIAFCDSATPKKTFNAYDELRFRLVARGIPKDQIVFVHEAKNEAQRLKMMKDFNDGKIRIMIGSTQKLGTGTNVQEKLIAIHHLDIPWRPSDMVQQEGRIIRQGNKNKEVFKFRYVTEGSLDAYIYQILENKQKFISSFLSGTMGSDHRSESELSDAILSYAEIKALAIGNPLLKERVKKANDLEHARAAWRQQKKQIEKMQKLAAELPDKIARRQTLLAMTIADARYYRKHKKPVTRADRIDLGTELLRALAGNTMKEKERIFDWYQNFEIVLPKLMLPDRPYIWLRRKAGGSYKVKMDGDSALGCSMRMDKVLEQLESDREMHQRYLDELLIRQRETREELDKGNPYDQTVSELASELAEMDRQLQAG